MLDQPCQVDGVLMHDGEPPIHCAGLIGTMMCQLSTTYIHTCCLMAGCHRRPEVQPVVQPARNGNPAEQDPWDRARLGWLSSVTRVAECI